MLTRLHSMALDGIEAIPCEIEVDVPNRGFKGPTIVGLPDAAVRESIHRIKSALSSCGYHMPKSSSVISLAPADLRKAGPAFDLPIALGLIFAGGLGRTTRLEQYMVLGELALDGRVRPVRGTLSAALLAAQHGRRGLIVPHDNATEAAVVERVEVIGVSTLDQAVGFLTGGLILPPASIDVEALFNGDAACELDFADVRGQEHVKRALMVTAAGGHNLLMIGPPGSGKTMLCRRLPSILPPMTLTEALDCTRIYSAAGLLPRACPLLTRRPVRAPHHTASGPALIGGGSIPQAGEVSLACHGVLFLDEFPEFQRSVLEMLRQPMEEGGVTVARAHSTVWFPAQFMLVAAMNPCPCGYFTDPRRPCKCSARQVERYLARISGPLVERIDIHLEVPAVPYGELRGRSGGTGSAEIRARVLEARRIQQQRFNGGGACLNSRMSTRDIRRHCPLDESGESLLRQAVTHLGLSARAHDKILRVARTIADLEGSGPIQAHHVTEAIQYRRLDRQL